MRPGRQYQESTQPTLISNMPDSEIDLDPNRFEGSFSGSAVLERDVDDDSTLARHAQRCWQPDRDATLMNDHWTKKTGKKRAFWSTIWTEKTDSAMDQPVWTISDQAAGSLISSGEESVVDIPKPIVDCCIQGGGGATGESNSNSLKGVVKETGKPLSDDDENNNTSSFPEPDKSGEKINRSRSSSICSSGSCSGTGIFSQEHLISQSQLLVQYVDHLETISWEDDQPSVLGVLVEMMTTVNHHIYCVDESSAGSDHQEHANLQAEIRREKRQIKNLVQELFGEFADAELADRLISQLDQ